MQVISGCINTLAMEDLDEIQIRIVKLILMIADVHLVNVPSNEW